MFLRYQHKLLFGTDLKRVIYYQIQDCCVHNAKCAHSTRQVLSFQRCTNTLNAVPPGWEPMLRMGSHFSRADCRHGSRVQIRNCCGHFANIAHSTCQSLNFLTHSARFLRVGSPCSAWFPTTHRMLIARSVASLLSVRLDNRYVGYIAWTRTLAGSGSDLHGQTQPRITTDISVFKASTNRSEIGSQCLA